MPKLPKNIRNAPIFGRMTLSRGQEKELDALWAIAVKKRAGMRCEVCAMAHDRLEAHHVIGRRNKTLRHIVSNGCSLCHAHHRYAEQNGIAFDDWIKASRGQKWWDDLQEYGREIKVWKDFSIIKQYLKEFIDD